MAASRCVYPQREPTDGGTSTDRQRRVGGDVQVHTAAKRSTPARSIRCRRGRAVRTRSGRRSGAGTASTIPTRTGVKRPVSSEERQREIREHGSGPARRRGRSRRAATASCWRAPTPSAPAVSKARRMNRPRSPRATRIARRRDAKPQPRLQATISGPRLYVPFMSGAASRGSRPAQRVAVGHAPALTRKGIDGRPL
jgi:hypothetical protein